MRNIIIATMLLLAAAVGTVKAQDNNAFSSFASIGVKGNNVEASGIIIADGVVLTAGHVVRLIENKYDTYVRFNDGIKRQINKTFSPHKALQNNPHTDSKNDLGLIYVDTYGQTVTDISCKPIKLAQPLWSISNPVIFRKWVSTGIVSALPPVYQPSGVLYSEVYYMSFGIAKGGSGSPVFNYNGTLVGIAIGYYSVENLNNAIVQNPKSICDFLNDYNVPFNEVE